MKHSTPEFRVIAERGTILRCQVGSGSLPERPDMDAANEWLIHAYNTMWRSGKNGHRGESSL